MPLETSHLPDSFARSSLPPAGSSNRSLGCPPKGFRTRLYGYEEEAIAQAWADLAKQQQISQAELTRAAMRFALKHPTAILPYAPSAQRQVTPAVPQTAPSAPPAAPQRPLSVTAPDDFFEQLRVKHQLFEAEAELTKKKQEEQEAQRRREAEEKKYWEQVCTIETRIEKSRAVVPRDNPLMDKETRLEWLTACAEQAERELQKHQQFIANTTARLRVLQVEGPTFPAGCSMHHEREQLGLAVAVGEMRRKLDQGREPRPEPDSFASLEDEFSELQRRWHARLDQLQRAHQEHQAKTQSTAGPTLTPPTTRPTPKPNAPPTSKREQRPHQLTASDSATESSLATPPRRRRSRRQRRGGRDPD